MDKSHQFKTGIFDKKKIKKIFKNLGLRKRVEFNIKLEEIIRIIE